MGLTDVRPYAWVSIAIVLTAGTSIICALGYLSLTNTRIRARAIRDFVLLKKNFLLVALSLFTLIYVQVVFRNVAYYRHMQMRDYVLANVSYNDVKPRLRDLGFDLISDLADNGFVIAANDTLEYVYIVVLMYVGFLPYFLELRGATPNTHTAQIFVRLILTYGFGMAVRGPLTVLTSLPGPAAHCIGADVDKRRPTSVSSLFELGSVCHNCGDLIFSGHMFTATTLVLVALYYSSRLVSRLQLFVIAGVLSCTFAAQIMAVLMSRSHYSVDACLGIIVGLYNWIAGLHFFPADASISTCEEDQEQLEQARAISIAVLQRS